MKKNLEEKAIEKGKNWMKKSKSLTHNYTHALNVSKHSLEIFKSLRESGYEESENIDESLILITSWWHDCFKSLSSKNTVYGELMEGFESAKIVSNELKDLVEQERLKMVLKSIKHHNNFIYFLLKGKRMDLLTRILIEADAVDEQEHSRRERKKLEEKTLWYIVLRSCVEPFFRKMQKKYILSEYAKCHMN